MSEFSARRLALVAVLLTGGLPALAEAQGANEGSDNTAYGTTSAEFLLFGAGARGHEGILLVHWPSR